MLKQILSAGYVDPELLEFLSEEQKDIVFQKMREDQVKKWRQREALLTEKKPSTERKPKVINFRIAKDGNPWVWVLGEHHRDLSYEEMIQKREREEEEKEKERLRIEAEELAKHETRDILLAPADKIEKNPHDLARTESVMDTVESARTSTSKSLKLWQKVVSNRSQVIRRMSIQEQDDYEKRRADEIYENMLHSIQVKKERVADIATEILKQWRQAEQVAKKHEANIRRRSMMLRQVESTDSSAVDRVFEKLPEHEKQALQRRLSDRRSGSFTSSSSGRTTTQSKPLAEARMKLFHLAQSSFTDADADAETRPKTMEHAIRWFKENEQPKGVGMDIDGTVSLWFHGGISKSEAERILISKPIGMFLIRISNKVWGYTASVRTIEKIKHYVLLATGGKYRFIGNNQPEFDKLTDLLKYYKYNPITWAEQEILLLPCEQTNEQLKVIITLFEDEADSDSEETAM